jgi:hypothetical protein
VGETVGNSTHRSWGNSVGNSVGSSADTLHAAANNLAGNLAGPTQAGMATSTDGRMDWASFASWLPWAPFASWLPWARSPLCLVHDPRMRIDSLAAVAHPVDKRHASAPKNSPVCLSVATAPPPMPVSCPSFEAYPPPALQDRQSHRVLAKAAAHDSHLALAWLVRGVIEEWSAFRRRLAVRIGALVCVKTAVAVLDEVQEAAPSMVLAAVALLCLASAWHGSWCTRRYQLPRERRHPCRCNRVHEPPSCQCLLQTCMTCTAWAQGHEPRDLYGEQLRDLWVQYGCNNNKSNPSRDSACA